MTFNSSGRKCIKGTVKVDPRQINVSKIVHFMQNVQVLVAKVQNEHRV